jgi:hypothetical protein
LCIMEAVVCTLKKLNIISSSECGIVLVIAFSRTLKFIVHGPDTKMCIFTDNACNQEVFQISSEGKI